MKILVSFSGGKDSQACLIQACREFSPANIQAVFCDTGWEHEFTYNHVQDTCQKLGVELVVIRNNKIGGFEELCKKMKWFPDSLHRMCTVQLKIHPMIDYLLTINDDVLIYQGIRAAESAARSKMPCSANYFQDYFEGNKKLHRKTDVLKWCEKHTATVERPMMGMTAQDIIDFILAAGQQPNPLYKRGCSRVGCYPCIYARLSEIKTMSHDDPYIKRVIKLENEVNFIRLENRQSGTIASLFAKGKIPARFCLKYGNGIPAFEDIINYVNRDDAVLNLFESDEQTSCMSIYHGLCE